MGSVSCKMLGWFHASRDPEWGHAGDSGDRRG